MKALVLFILYAGLFEFRFARDRLQSFTCLKERFVPGKSSDYCTSINESLITIFDEEHVHVLLNCSTNCEVKDTGIWVGLGKKNRTGSTWSDGTEVTFHESSVTAGEFNQTCEALDNGTWKGFNCSERKFFMCNTRDGYIVIESQKNWCQALQFCKKNHGSLARIKSSEENERAKNESKGLTVWIGLVHDQWEWRDRKCSLYREWDKINDETSVFLKAQKPYSLDQAASSYDKCVVCSKGEVRIKVIRQESSWDEALTYCETFHSRLLWIEDQSDQNAVSSWLNHSSFDENAPRSLWIGLRQSALFGFWIWSDRMVNWSNWEDGDIPGKSPFNHCGVIDRKNFTWRNEDCNRKLPFLCEEDIAYLKN
ncbi:hypothetical protein OJAV_G00224660 [Oryzias javanicus]|uniref:C-type lectin domain-containing protein n=1 Tax=Oryzias javanicus TaxID=123683 RepID=A0A3S2MD06_ORYJA|nr:hypothetical protein OJAV_G00224660 [Oryzias javanicus]